MVLGAGAAQTFGGGNSCRRAVPTDYCPASPGVLRGTKRQSSAQRQVPEITHVHKIPQEPLGQGHRETSAWSNPVPRRCGAEGLFSVPVP